MYYIINDTVTGETWKVTQEYLDSKDIILREYIIDHLDASAYEKNEFTIHKYREYQVKWTRQEYGYINMYAKDEQHAREKFEQGDYMDVDLVVRDGGLEIDEVSLLD